MNPLAAIRRWIARLCSSEVAEALDRASQCKLDMQIAMRAREQDLEAAEEELERLKAGYERMLEEARNDRDAALTARDEARRDRELQGKENDSLRHDLNELTEKLEVADKRKELEADLHEAMLARVRAMESDSHLKRARAEVGMKMLEPDEEAA